MDNEDQEATKFRDNKQECKKNSESGDHKTIPKRAHIFSNITLEPAMAGALMALFLIQTSQINLYMRTACLVDLEFPREVCESGTGEEYKKAEIATQEYLSKIKGPRGFVIAVISTTVLLFTGPWSDCSRRRRPLLILSLLGMCISSMNGLILLTFPYLSSGWVIYIIQLPFAMGGGFNLLIAAGFCYISDVCVETGRDPMIVFSTNRAAIQFAKVLGSISGPFIFRQFGFYGVYFSALFLQVSGLVFVLCRVRDVRANTENRVSVLDVRLPWAAVRCLFAPRLHHRRTIVLMMILVAVTDRAMLEADDLLLFLYFRNKFQWNDLMFGFFTSYHFIIIFCGTIFSIKVLKTKLRMSDEMIGVLSGVSLAASKLTLIASPTSVFVLLVPLVGFVSIGSFTVQRTIVNKHIDPSEQGKIHSVAGGLEQAFQAAVIPLFTLLYSHTAENAPDSWLGVYVCKGCLHAALFLFTIALTKRQRAAERQVPEQLVLATKGLESGNITRDVGSSDVKGSEMQALNSSIEIYICGRLSEEKEDGKS